MQSDLYPCFPLSCEGEGRDGQEKVHEIKLIKFYPVYGPQSEVHKLKKPHKLLHLDIGVFIPDCCTIEDFVM